MQGLIKFMNGTVGRIARIVLGVVLVYFGFYQWAPAWYGYALGLFGVAAFFLGLSGRCLLELFASKPKAPAA